MDQKEQSDFEKMLDNARLGFVEEVDISKIEMPANYTCSCCGLRGHKLWRQWSTFADQIQLLCVRCAEKDQKTTLYFRTLSCGKRIKSDQIGNLCPALPAYDTYWGYTSAPEGICQWWYSLPL